MIITHCFLSFHERTLHSIILSAGFYPDPCETEKKLLLRPFCLDHKPSKFKEPIMLFFRPPHAWVIGSPKCSVFAFIKDYSLSVSISTQSYSSVRFSQRFIHDMTWCHTDQWLFNFCLFVWDLAVPESMQPVDIRPHHTLRPHHQGDEYLQVTYLLASRQRLMMSRFDTYSIANTMYDPVPNLRNCCKAGDDGHWEEEMMAVEKDSEVEHGRQQKGPHPLPDFHTWHKCSR